MLLKNTTETLAVAAIAVTTIIIVSVGFRYDGVVQVKLGLDGGQLIIDGRQSKSKAPPSLE